jgi:hypothetical protein
MTNPKQNKQVDKDGNIPRQVRMPPVLDQWLQEEAAQSTVRATVADKIREIVAAAYEAKQNEQQAA